MRMLLVVAVGLSLAACGQESDPQAEKLAKVQAELAAAKAETATLKAQVAATAGPDPDPSLVAAEPAPPSPAPISAKDMGRVCRASIGAIMGRDPAIISAKTVSDGLVETKYTRDDGTVWKNQCRFEQGRVVWRTVDAFGPGSGLGRWRNEDEILFRIEANGRIWIKQSMSGSLISEETVTVR